MSLEELFCLVDDFCTVFMPEWEKRLLTSGHCTRKRSGNLVISEIMTLYLLFQSSGYRDFKHFYTQSVLQGPLKAAFPRAVAYTRFVALIPRIFVPLCTFLQSIRATTDGIAFIDSTLIAVCHNKRTSSHKVFRGIAALGKTTKGWFYGFKLHLICNSRGELCAGKITPGNWDDRRPVRTMAKELTGKLVGDKGYIDQKLSQFLLEQGLKLITGIRKGMKNKLMPLLDKLLLRKRSLIESTNNQLKNVFHLEHSRHRSAINGFANMLAAIIAYALHPNKPTLKFTQQEKELLMTA